MKHAETVTFGGAGFDRAADIRDDPERLQAFLDLSTTRILPVWRGKPLTKGADCDQLAFLPPDHTIFDDAPEPPVFLGSDGETPVFAHDISAWPGPEADISQLGSFVDISEQCHPDLPDDLRFAELRRIMARLSAKDAELAAMAVGVFAWHKNHRHCARCGEKSDISTGGWQRICASCNGHHFPRTDPVVIMLITHGNDVLIGRSHGWPDGMYSLLAGFMEPGETIEAAVRREISEETGVSVGPVGYLASQPWPFPSSLMIGCWGEATSRDITIDEKEIDDAKWVSRESILEAWATRSSVLVAARKGAIAHFLIKNWLSDTLS